MKPPSGSTTVSTAPGKQLVWFSRSAHTPHLEEPAKFRDLLMNVRASQLASAKSASWPAPAQVSSSGTMALVAASRGPTCGAGPVGGFTSLKH